MLVAGTTKEALHFLIGYTETVGTQPKLKTMKKHHTLLIGVSIPILMILFIIFSINWPVKHTLPHYDFLYSSGNYPIEWSQIRIVQGKIMSADPETALSDKNSDERLYLYDTAQQTVVPINFKLAKDFTLITTQTSPDGFKIQSAGQQAMSYPWPFLTSRNNSIRYLLGPGYSQKIQLQYVDNDPNNFLFLGWISHEQTTAITRH